MQSKFRNVTINIALLRFLFLSELLALLQQPGDVEPGVGHNVWMWQLRGSFHSIKRRTWTLSLPSGAKRRGFFSREVGWSGGSVDLRKLSRIGVGSWWLMLFSARKKIKLLLLLLVLLLLLLLLVVVVVVVVVDPGIQHELHSDIAYKFTRRSGKVHWRNFER